MTPVAALHFGVVPGYWCLALRPSFVHGPPFVPSREAHRFSRAAELSRGAGDVLTTLLLPGLDMPLARVFRD